jgi:hypothetical protein
MFPDLLAEKIAASRTGEEWRICGSLSLSPFSPFRFLCISGPAHFKSPTFELCVFAHHFWLQNKLGPGGKPKFSFIFCFTNW